LRTSVVVAEDQVQRALVLWLRGESYAAIGRTLGVHRQTAAELVRQAYAEVRESADVSGRQMVAEAVERMRGVQRQAWADHDADEEREVALLERALAGQLEGVRIQSQRAQYLKVILEAEKEIARLQGLYDGYGGDAGGPFVMRLIKVVPGQPVEVEEFVDSGGPPPEDFGDEGDSDDEESEE
jgi:hypothetical protein